MRATRIRHDNATLIDRVATLLRYIESAFGDGREREGPEPFVVAQSHKFDD